MSFARAVLLAAPLLASAIAGGAARGAPPRTAAPAIVVLRPELGAGVAAPEAARAWAAIRRVGRRLPGVAFLGATPSELAPAPSGIGCVADPACLARAGRRAGGEIVLGTILLRSSGGLVMTLQAVEVRTGRSVGRTQRVIRRPHLGSEPGTVVAALVGSLPPRALEGDPGPAGREVPGVLGAIARASAANQPAANELSVSTRLGSFLPEGTFVPGVSAGLAIGLRPRRGPLQLTVHVDHQLTLDRLAGPSLRYQREVTDGGAAPVGAALRTTHVVPVLGLATIGPAGAGRRLRPYAGGGAGAAVALEETLAADGSSTSRRRVAATGVLAAGVAIAVGPGAVVLDLQSRHAVAGAADVAGAHLVVTLGYQGTILRF